MSETPVVVVFGGPSAEHDVSIVSGTAIADALRGRGDDVRQVLIDLEGAWWWLPADHRRGDRPPAAYDEPAALGAEAPLTAGAAIDRLAAASPRPIVFIVTVARGDGSELAITSPLLSQTNAPPTCGMAPSCASCCSMASLSGHPLLQVVAQREPLHRRRMSLAHARQLRAHPRFQVGSL